MRVERRTRAIGIGAVRTGGYSLAVIFFSASLASAGEPADRPPRDGLAVFPRIVELTGRGAAQRILVQARRDGRTCESLDVDAFEVKLEPPGIAAYENGSLVAVADGTARLRIRAGREEAEATVIVRQARERVEWSFRNHVQSVLAKAGCNSGACHGAAAGKNGFKLSLRGYDAGGDFSEITRGARGRRIAPEAPAESLLLLKPTGAVPHKGGVRFDVDSLEYRVLAEWIARGSPPPQTTDARITRLEILPANATLRPGDEQQMVVLAHFSDGHVEDVTPWAKYDVTVTTTARVDEKGLLTVVGPGECSVTAWYLSRIAIATTTVPYDTGVGDDAFDRAPRRNFVDDHVLAKLRALRLPPSPRSSDAEFLRRAFLDTIGVLPTAEETRAFLADDRADKRDRLIEELLGREEFVDYWSYRWSDLLLVSSNKLPKEAMWAYYSWVRSHVEAGTPWNRIARELVTATGSTKENGATNFFVLHPDPTEMAEATSLTFLGLSIGCAKCHNHPLEKWTNDQYFAMANLFSRVRSKSSGGGSVVFSASAGELVQPLTGRPQPPRPLDGEALDFTASADRREHLADWLVDASNPYFSRSIVNRVWANFLGVGLVDPVDDLRVTNPPTNGPLLNALAGYLQEQNYDLRALMRAILQSETYQRSSRALPENRSDRRFYARYFARRLSAEVLLDAYSQVTGVPTKFPGYPSGWRAIELPDSNVDSYFLRSFGRPKREQTCACERTSESSVAQILHIANGSTLNDKLGAKTNKIDRVLGEKWSDERAVENLYLSALSRLPSEKERRALAGALGETPESGRRAFLEDLYWSVLSSKKFIFNH